MNTNNTINTKQLYQSCIDDFYSIDLLKLLYNYKYNKYSKSDDTNIDNINYESIVIDASYKTYKELDYKDYFNDLINRFNSLQRYPHKKYIDIINLALIYINNQKDDEYIINKAQELYDKGCYQRSLNLLNNCHYLCYVQKYIKLCEKKLRRQKIREKVLPILENVFQIFIIVATFATILTLITLSIVYTTKYNDQVKILGLTKHIPGLVIMTSLELIVSISLIARRKQQDINHTHAWARVDTVLLMILIGFQIPNLVCNLTSHINTRFNPASNISIKTTNMSKNTSTQYETRIDIDVSNYNNFDVLSFKGNMDIYDNDTLIDSWTITFNYETTIRNSTRSCYLTFKEDTPKIYNIEYDNLHIIYTINEMSFRDSGNGYTITYDYTSSINIK